MDAAGRISKVYVAAQRKPLIYETIWTDSNEGALDAIAALVFSYKFHYF